MKLANSKDKEKILKAARDKSSLTYMGRNIRLIATSPQRPGRPERAGRIYSEHAAKNTLSSKAVSYTHLRAHETVY